MSLPEKTPEKSLQNYGEPPSSISLEVKDEQLIIGTQVPSKWVIVTYFAITTVLYFLLFKELIDYVYFFWISLAFIGTIYAFLKRKNLFLTTFKIILTEEYIEIQRFFSSNYKIKWEYFREIQKSDNSQSLLDKSNGELTILHGSDLKTKVGSKNLSLEELDFLHNLIEQVHFKIKNKLFFEFPYE